VRWVQIRWAELSGVNVSPTTKTTEFAAFKFCCGESQSQLFQGGRAAVGTNPLGGGHVLLSAQLLECDGPRDVLLQVRHQPCVVHPAPGPTPLYRPNPLPLLGHTNNPLTHLLPPVQPTHNGHFLSPPYPVIQPQQ